MNRSNGGKNKKLDRDFRSLRWEISVEDMDRFGAFRSTREFGTGKLFELMEEKGVAVRFKPQVTDRYPTVSVTVVDPASDIMGHNVWWYVSGSETMVASACYFLDYIGVKSIYDAEDEVNVL